ncbi:MAG TPA: hypothetical protein VJ385_20210 [Fibrobacteria bacterium]|nr:hypothetical protein [Fibrobacteria bacterium]
MRKAKMGRPPKKEKDKRKHRVSVSLTDRDLESLEVFKDKTGMDQRTQQVRFLFLEALRRYLDPQKNPGKGGKAKS